MKALAARQLMAEVKNPQNGRGTYPGELQNVYNTIEEHIRESRGVSWEVIVHIASLNDEVIGQVVKQLREGDGYKVRTLGNTLTINWYN